MEIGRVVVEVEPDQSGESWLRQSHGNKSACADGEGVERGGIGLWRVQGSRRSRAEAAGARGRESDEEGDGDGERKRNGTWPFEPPFP